MQMALLDAGICIELSNTDHEHLARALTLSHPFPSNRARPLTCGWLCMQSASCRRWSGPRVASQFAPRAAAPARARARLGLGSGSEVSSDDAWLRQWQWQSCQEIGLLRSSTSCAVSSRRMATRPVLSFLPRPKTPGSSLLWRGYCAVPQSPPQCPQQCAGTAVFALRCGNGTAVPSCITRLVPSVAVQM